MARILVYLPAMVGDSALLPAVLFGVFCEHLNNASCVMCHASCCHFIDCQSAVLVWLVGCNSLSLTLFFVSSLWFVLCYIGYHLRSKQAIALMADMVDHAAFESQGRDFYLEDSDAVDELLAKGFIKSTHDDWGFYTLTINGKLLFKAGIELTARKGLHQYMRADLDRNEMSAFELCSLLGSRGWSDKLGASSNDCEPITLTNMVKVWFRHPNKPVSKTYLKVLLEAKPLLRQGLPAIHHFQSEAYLDYVISEVILSYIMLLYESESPGPALQLTTRHWHYDVKLVDCTGTATLATLTID